MRSDKRSGSYSAMYLVNRMGDCRMLCSYIRKVVAISIRKLHVTALC